MLGDVVEDEDAGITLAVQGHPLFFTGSSKLPRSKVLFPGAGLSFNLFYLSMNKVSSKIPLPLSISVQHELIHINKFNRLSCYKD